MRRRYGLHPKYQVAAPSFPSNGREKNRAGAGPMRGPGVIPKVWLRKVPGAQSIHSKQQGCRPTGFFFCPGWQFLEHMDTGIWEEDRRP